MVLQKFIGRTLAGPLSLVRRRVAAILLCIAASLGSLFYFLAAANIALESAVGPAGSRAIIGGVFLLVAAGAIVVPRLFRGDSAAEDAQTQMPQMTREEKIALVVEAILAGFSLSSRRSQPSK
ncbi:MAG TPA: hypothetical protein VHA55_09610 [Pseudorhodoplanes sp.]|jgi:hypothetical protein|nr:hypothetical protein [Pseudorhodoplanes sp.]